MSSGRGGRAQGCVPGAEVMALHPREPSEQLVVPLFFSPMAGEVPSARSLLGLSYARVCWMACSPTRCFEGRIRPSLYPWGDATEVREL